MAYESPLVYALGYEGLGLLRALAAGQCDRDFVEGRLAELRRLLADETLVGAGTDIERVDTVTGYREWSRTYDEPGNPAFDVDQPVITEIVDGFGPAPPWTPRAAPAASPGYLPTAGTGWSAWTARRTCSPEHVPAYPRARSCPAT